LLFVCHCFSLPSRWATTDDASPQKYKTKIAFSNQIAKGNGDRVSNIGNSREYYVTRLNAMD
jgi:hypothetical protein